MFSYRGTYVEILCSVNTKYIIVSKFVISIMSTAEPSVYNYTYLLFGIENDIEWLSFFSFVRDL